jgi:hypothetical protein
MRRCCRSAHTLRSCAPWSWLGARAGGGAAGEGTRAARLRASRLTPAPRTSYRRWWDEKDELLKLAIKCYEEVTRQRDCGAQAPRSEDMLFLANHHWAGLLVQQALRYSADHLYAQAGDKYRAALRFRPDACAGGRGGG